MPFDLAIIGAGPAGATLARLVGKEYRVLLLDKRHLDQEPDGDPVHKCCGGLLAPDAQKMLARLGLGVPQSVLVGQQLFVVRTIDLENGRERYYQREYLNMNREKFDRWLVSLIPSEVDCRFGTVFHSYTREDGLFTVKFTQGGREFEERARVLVGADGASSLLRKLAFPDHPFPKTYISIQEWFEGDPLLPYFSAFFDRSLTDYYAWTIPKDNFLLLGAALKPGDEASARFEALKEKLRVHGYTLGKRVRREGAFIRRPVSTRQICTGGDGIALLGEAAGWISPSSAEGISFAFHSALHLARSLQEGGDDWLRHYRANTLGMRRTTLLKNLKSPFMYSWLRKPVMLSGLESIAVEEPDQGREPGAPAGTGTEVGIQK